MNRQSLAAAGVLIVLGGALACESPSRVEETTVATNKSVMSLSGACQTAPTLVSSHVLSDGRQMFKWDQQDNFCRLYHWFELRVSSTDAVLESGEPFVILNNGLFEYTQAGVERGVFHKWRVRNAYSDRIWGPYSPYATFAVSLLPPVISGSVQGGLAHLSWSPVTNAVTYRVYRQASNLDDGSGGQCTTGWELWTETTGLEVSTEPVIEYLGTSWGPYFSAPRYSYWVEAVSAEGVTSAHDYTHHFRTWADQGC